MKCSISSVLISLSKSSPPISKLLLQKSCLQCKQINREFRCCTRVLFDAVRNQFRMFSLIFLLLLKDCNTAALEINEEEIDCKKTKEESGINLTFTNLRTNELTSQRTIETINNRIFFKNIFQNNEKQEV